MNIHVIAAALPPQLDGIGDYTANLAAELAHTATVTVLTGAPAPDPIPGVRVETAFIADEPRSVWDLVGQVAEDKPDWVLLQYNPFSYGRWGLNLHLPRVMQQIKRRCPSVRVAVMAHETFVPFGVNWQFRTMTLWQRPQFAFLSRTADVLFFSVESWAETFDAKFPGKPVVHLPVGSNVPNVPISRSEARARLGISEEAFVLGLFGAMHISRRMDWVRNAAQAVCASGRETLVLYVGPHDAAVRDALGALPLRADGALPADEVSRRFAGMDVNLTPFVDGVSTRRGSMMTGLQHGVATVGTLGQHTDRVLREADGSALMLASNGAPEQFTAQVLCLADDLALQERIGQAGRQLYEREFAWANVARRMQDALASAES